TWRHIQASVLTLTNSTWPDRSETSPRALLIVKSAKVDRGSHSGKVSIVRIDCPGYKQSVYLCALCAEPFARHRYVAVANNDHDASTRCRSNRRRCRVFQSRIRAGN